MSMFDGDSLVQKLIKTGDNALGVGTTERSLGKLLELRGDNARPEPVTVFCSFLDAVTYSPAPGLFLRCDIGQSRVVDVDLCQGLSFSFYCSFISIELLCAPQVTSGVNNITVGVAPGLRPSPFPPTRTLPKQNGSLALVAAGANGDEAVIPAYARGVTPLPKFSGSTTLADFVLRQKYATGNSPLSHHPFIQTGFMSGPRIPLHKDATHVDIDNVDVANGVTMGYSFDLAI